MMALVRGVIFDFDLGGVHVPGQGLDIDDNRRRARPNNRGGAGNDRESRKDHFVTRARCPARQRRVRARQSRS